MCLGLPGKIIKIDEHCGIVETMGVTREVSLELLQGAQVGDYVLVHAGCAIQKLDEEEASRTLKLFKELQDIMHE